MFDKCNLQELGEQTRIARGDALPGKATAGTNQEGHAEVSKVRSENRTREAGYTLRAHKKRAPDPKAIPFLRGDYPSRSVTPGHTQMKTSAPVLKPTSVMHDALEVTPRACAARPPGRPGLLRAEAV
jgi:hypothetical protein